jgi:signal transduction histidine kinase
LGHEDLICRILGNGANSLGSIGEYGLALEFYQEMRRHLSPANPMAFWLLVVASGNEADIHLDMARALGAASDTVLSAEHLSQAIRLAQDSCEQCLQVGWSFYDPLHTLVSALLERGEVQQARGWLDRLQASHLPVPASGSRDEAALELTHALVELREDNTPLALTLERLRISEQQPHSAFRDGDYGCQVLRCLSEVLERLGDSEQALACFRQLVQRQARVQSTVARERAKLMRRTLMMLRGETEEFITHDLRNPLGAALVQLQSLQRSSKVQASLQNGLETAIQNIRNSLDIADHHLMMTRAENLSLDVLGVLDLAELTDDVCEQMSGPATAQVHLEREIEFNIPIQGDRKLLMHSLSNLLSNAFKYAPPGSTVRVRLARQPDGQEACLSVIDQGPGLPASMRTRFFQRFAGTVNARPQGSPQGLGLALVARTARLHGARIAVHAIADQGTTVSLFFALNR